MWNSFNMPKILAGKIRKFISQHGLEAKEFPFAMIAELLNELSFKEKQEFSPNERRTSKYFNDLKKMQNNFFSLQELV